MTELAQVLRHVHPVLDPKALVDAATGDDAAVYLLEEDRALVVTVDFFTPVVDDPFDFGRIAVANALSDIYAMGGRPLFALNLLAFPRKHLDEEILGRLLEGGAEKADEAGVPILGGHSIDDPEPKYGLVAVGDVHPKRLVTNAAARVGQKLVLTKALGTGVITTALKAGRVERPVLDPAVDSMAALNRGAAEAMREVGVETATDVTGFGLLGHLRQMLRASGVAARLEWDRIPFLPGVVPLAHDGSFPGGTHRNLSDVSPDVEFPDSLTQEDRLLLADAQTSGGLLMAVAPERLNDLLAALEGRAPLAAVIGEIEEGRPGTIRVV